MRGVAIACALSGALIWTPAESQTAEIPFYGCVSSVVTGEPILIVGELKGLRRGTAAARLTDGATCKGRWSGRVDGGAIHARCSDGRKISLFFQELHAATGTLTGKGSTNRGEQVVGWAGPDIALYLETVVGAPRGTVPCDGRNRDLPGDKSEAPLAGSRQAAG